MVKPLINTECLVKACEELGIPYSFYDDNHNLVMVSLKQNYFFANAATPFSNDSINRIFKEKEFTYKVTHEVVKSPKTIGFMDPNGEPEFKRFLKYKSISEITDEILKNFSLPVIIKMNSGNAGVNVFKCDTKESIPDALNKIYSKNSKNYDFIALAQEYIDIKREFRVVVFQNEIQFMYEKDFSKAEIVDDNISPLHRKNSKAVIIKDTKFIQKIQKFIEPIFKKIPIEFAGFDIAIDDKGELWLIEINSRLGFGYFARDNGTDELVKMYKKMLVFLQKKK